MLIRLSTFFGMLLFVCIAMAASPASASAATYYVAPTGKDSNAGTIDAPFGTIQKGVDVSKPGDVVLIRGGTYHERLHIRRSGTAAQPIRIAAYPNELPVIDGRYELPEGKAKKCYNDGTEKRCSVSIALVRIAGSHIEFEGIKVTRSRGVGIAVRTASGSENITIRNCQVHETRNGAINGARLNGFTVEGCDVYHAGNVAPVDRPGSEMSWAPVVSVGDSQNVTYRNNRIHENWGEGLSAGVGSSDITIEDNVIFNNFALQLYINRSRNVTVQRNLIYHTNDANFYRNGNPSQCLVMNNEVVDRTDIMVKDITIRNNVMIGCSRNIALWGGEDPDFPFTNISITHNTLVNAHTNTDSRAPQALVIVKDANIKNVAVERNIILQDNGNVGNAPAKATLSFEQNLWSHSPPDSMASANDVVGDPQLVNANAELTGAVLAEWYAPLPTSPAVEHNMGPFELLNQPTDYCCQLYLPIITQESTATH